MRRLNQDAAAPAITIRAPNSLTKGAWKKLELPKDAAAPAIVMHDGVLSAESWKTALTGPARGDRIDKSEREALETYFRMGVISFEERARLLGGVPHGDVLHSNEESDEDRRTRRRRYEEMMFSEGEWLRSGLYADAVESGEMSREEAKMRTFGSPGMGAQELLRAGRTSYGPDWDARSMKAWSEARRVAPMPQMLQVHDELVPTGPRFACRSHGCPTRAPVVATSAPRCYTCGCAMTEAA